MDEHAPEKAPSSASSSVAVLTARLAAAVSSTAAAGEVRSGDIPYRKGAGVYRAPGSPAKDPDPKAQAPKAKPLTLDELAAQWRVADRRSGHSTVRLGCLAYLWLKRAVDRPAALKQLRDRLAADGFHGERLKVARYIGCYWVARLFSGDAVGQPAQEHPAEMVGSSILRALIPLCRRDPRTERWSIRVQCRAEAEVLWARILADRPTIATVAAEVARIRPPHVPAVAPAARSLKRLLRALGRLSLAEAAQAAEVLQKRLQHLRAA